MAKQFGTHKLRGTIGDVTYSRSRKGFKARQRAEVSKEKRETSPNLQGWRDHLAEFGRAAKAAKLVRTAFYPLIGHNKDKQLVTRLVTRMNQVIKLDAVNRRGLRNVPDGKLTEVEGFEFNAMATLSGTLLTPYGLILDRTTGEVTLVIDSFPIKNRLKYPQKTTHFRVSMGAALINFLTEEVEVSFAESDFINVAVSNVPQLSLTASLTPTDILPLFVAVKVEFVQEINGDLYPIPNNELTPCTVVKVDTGG